MVHDPVEQGDDKYNSFLGSMFILRADVSGTEMLILLLYFNPILDGVRAHPILDGGGAKSPLG